MLLFLFAVAGKEVVRRKSYMLVSKRSHKTAVACASAVVAFVVVFCFRRRVMVGFLRPRGGGIGVSISM